jgi:hypothetical protein
MGEAKERSKVPWPREMHIERYEQTDLLNYLVTPVQGAPRITKNRDERKSMKSAMTQLGLYQMWKASQSGEKTSFVLPKVRVAKMSEEAVNYLLGVMTDMSNAASLSLIEFEERLEELKAGLYEVPEDARERAEQPVEAPPSETAGQGAQA